MNNFSFYNPVKIHFGKAQITEKLPKEIGTYNKIMLCFGGGSIKSNGVYNQVIEALNGKSFVEFSGIEPNPDYETLMKAVELAKNESVDFILAVGGGSVIDGVKFIAAAVFYNHGEPWEILSKRAKITKALPFGAVLTLPATGSEMNSNAVISRRETNEKLDFSNRNSFPVFSILDPETMYSLPDTQISNGIVDSFVHVTEQYLTYPVNAPIQDRFAESILRTLIEEGPKLLKNRNDYESNANLMWASTMALNGLLRCGVPEDWSTHMIGHELTALFGIDHAKTLAIVLPGVLTILQDPKKQKLLQYGNRVWNINGNEADSIEEIIDVTEGFFQRLGIRTRLRDYKISQNDIDVICKRLEDRGYVELGENKNVSPDMVRKILESRL